MADLSCKYLSLELKSPLIIGNVSDIEQIKEYAKLGAAAIILKPLFEENILDSKETILLINESISGITQNAKDYINLIREIKNAVSIPVFASINCISADNWPLIIPFIEEAGADALELNVFIYPQDKDFRSDDYENVFLDIITRSTYNAKIPVSLKIGPYFTHLLNIVDQVFYRGIKGVELFSRYYQPDIDLETLELKASNLLSVVSDFNHTMHWTAIISSRVSKLDILASANINEGESAIKLLLSGANAISLFSTPDYNLKTLLPMLLLEMNDWMDTKGFDKIEHIHGQANYEHIKNTGQYLRSEMLRIQ